MPTKVPWVDDTDPGAAMAEALGLPPRSDPMGQSAPDASGYQQGELFPTEVE